MTPDEKRLSEQQCRASTVVQLGPAYNSVSQIPMHITPWFKDENGIPTRQIWAVGTVIDRS